MSRSNSSLLFIGALGGLTASVGIGYGLGQYTVSGLNPFYAERQWSRVSYTPATGDTAYFSERRAEPDATY